VRVWCGREVLHWRHLAMLVIWKIVGEKDGLSSIYQLHGNSTSVFSVGGAGAGSGFIHVVAETSGEKFIGVMGGLEGRK